MDTLLNKCSSRLVLFVEVSGTGKAATAWSDQRKGFIVSLPKKQVFQPAELFPIFRGELLSCFEALGTAPSQKLPERLKEASSDDWAEVDVVAETTRPPKKNRVEFMPSVDSLPRPDQLFLRPPYHLTVTTAGNSSIELQCSHSPTLQFLADYLKRWCRVNHNDTTNVSSFRVGGPVVYLS